MVDPASLRARKKERTRAAIARAALELFAERGYDAVTLTEVADAADVGHRTLFRYFADKEELLFGDDAAVQAHVRVALAARPATEPPGTAVLEALVSLAPWWQDDRKRGRLRRAVIEAAPALVARQRTKHSDYERVLLEELAARGLKQPQARLLARAAVACVDEAITRWLADRDPDEPGLAGRIRGTWLEPAQQLAPTTSERRRGTTPPTSPGLEPSVRTGDGC